MNIFYYDLILSKIYIYFFSAVPKVPEVSNWSKPDLAFIFSTTNLPRVGWKSEVVA